MSVDIALLRQPYQKIDSVLVDGERWYTIKCNKEVAEWQEFTSAGGTRWRQLAEKPYIEIKTISEKQESMLQLKYSNNLYLSRIEYEDIDMVPYSR